MLGKCVVVCKVGCFNWGGLCVVVLDLLNGSYFVCVISLLVYFMDVLLVIGSWFLIDMVVIDDNCNVLNW